MIQRTEKISHGISRVLSIGAEVCICALIGLVSYSAISRYAFSQGIYFMEEVGGLLLMAISFLSFAYVFSLGRHIKVTLITDKLPKAIKNWLEVAVGVVSLVYFAIFIKLSLDFVYRSYQLDCHTVDARLYEVPWMALMPAGIIVCAIVVLAFSIGKVYSTVAKIGRKKEAEVTMEKIE